MPTSESYLQCAVARRKVGDLSGALVDYDRVIQLDPEDSDAYRNRGIVKQMLDSRLGPVPIGVLPLLWVRRRWPWINRISVLSESTLVRCLC